MWHTYDWHFEINEIMEVEPAEKETQTWIQYAGAAETG